MLKDGVTIDKLNVAVLFGGRSSEHEISLRSTVYALKNIPEHYSITLVGISRSGTWNMLDAKFQASDFKDCTVNDLAKVIAGELPAIVKTHDTKNIQTTLLPIPKSELSKLDFASTNFLNIHADIVFPVLHGPNGEDGRIQALCELAELPYVGCNMSTSAIGMDKDVQKRLVKEKGVAIANYVMVDSDEWTLNQTKVISEIEKSLSYPCFIKPNAQGSAVGTGRAHNQKELIEKIQLALSYDERALVEENLKGSEVEVGFLGNYAQPRISIAGEIVTQDFYSYEAKYLNDTQASIHIPARMSDTQMSELKGLAREVARALNLFGLCRIDFWLCANTSRFIFNEVNTIPGMTSISMFPKVWEHEKCYGPEWIEQLLQGAVARSLKRQKLEYGLKF